MLFLGKAELLTRGAQLYNAVDVRHRLFAMVVKDNCRERLAIMSDANQNYVFTPSVATLQLYPSAIDALSNPLLILDASYALVAVNEPARQLLGTQPTDLGRAIHRLETPVWPIDIRALAEECLTQRRPVTVEQTSWPTIGNPGRCYDVRVSNPWSSFGRQSASASRASSKWSSGKWSSRPWTPPTAGGAWFIAASPARRSRAAAAKPVASSCWSTRSQGSPSRR